MHPPPTSPKQISDIGTPILLEPQEAQIVLALRKHSQLSRTDIAEITGYSRAKITGVVARMVEQGILHEVGEGASTGGRRPRLLKFNRDFGYFVGVDMGATSLHIALADFNGDILSQNTEPIDVRDGPDVVLGAVDQIITRLLEQHNIPGSKLYGIGIDVPGPVDFNAGVLIVPPIMPGWEAYPIREYFRNSYPSAVITVDNDVNVMALGELRAGAGVDVDNFILVKIGTGIGSGIVARGEIYRGSSGCAGDIGHITADRNGPVCHCGNIGCLEAMAAGPPIAMRAMNAANAGKSSILSTMMDKNAGQLRAEHVGMAAQEGDPAASEIIQDSGRMVGEVLAGLVNFFNPSLILISGGVSHLGDQLLVAIRRAVLHRSLPLSTRHLRIDFSPMDDAAGITGAISLALDHLFITEK